MKNSWERAISTVDVKNLTSQLKATSQILNAVVLKVKLGVTRKHSDMSLIQQQRENA